MNKRHCKICGSDLPVNDVDEGDECKDCLVDKKKEKKTRHVVEDIKRSPLTRKHRDMILPSGERITRHQAKKISKEEQEKAKEDE